MDNKILSFLPKIYFPESIFWGEKSFLFFKSIENEKKLIVVSDIFKKLNSDLLESAFHKEAQYFIQEKEPTIEDFNKLKQLCLKDKPAYLIAIGGGSVIDLAKLVKRDLGIKMAAVPTTISSGAEVSQHAILIENNEKKVQSSSALLPETALINPLTVKSLNREQIILQSIDALSHGLESLVSKISNPFSDNFSLMAIEIIYSNLCQLADSGDRDKILAELQIGAVLAGLAQSSAATGLAHAFSHYFGAINKISHSRLISVFLIDVLELNSKHTDKYQKLDQLKGLSSKDFIPCLKNLFDKLGIKLEKIEIKQGLEQAAQAIKKDICIFTNPYSPTLEDITGILKKHE